jgi:hypothetical protein
VTRRRQPLVASSSAEIASLEARIVALEVLRGDGEFALSSIVDSGYPHLTFYGADGDPFGGVYFGSGGSVLEKKRWRYRNP